MYIPNTCNEIKSSVSRDDIFRNYQDGDIFVNEYFKNNHPELVVVIAGSRSDEEWVTKIRKELDKKNLNNTAYYSSAHKNTLEVMGILIHIEVKIYHKKKK